MKKYLFKHYLKEVTLGLLWALFVVFVGFLVATFFIYKYQTPNTQELVNFHPAQTSVIYDRTGTQVLYEIHGEENRKVLTHNEIPDVIRIATVATEDKNFYTHFGVDFLSIFRALKSNLETGEISQGGSTITQQLARNIYLTPEKTLRRKFMEMLIAIKLERSFTKDQILDMYLNEVPYGSNAYGISAASNVFFGKEAKDLTLDEAVFLASLPKAPSYFSPYGNNIEKINARYRNILDKIEVSKTISIKEIDEAKKTNVIAKIKPFLEPIIAPHFVFNVIEQLEKEYGRDFLEKGGLKVITTLDLNLQKIAEKTVADGVVKNKNYNASNATLVAVDPKSGDVLALVGSRNFFDKSIDGQVNVATSNRQPGSAFKPIVYAAAFEKGYQPETLIADVKTDFGPDGSGSDYIPRNYDGQFHGILPMRKTLAMSLNIPAIKTLSLVGIDSAINMAQRLGITTLTDQKRYGLSMAIGGAEVKPIEMASAFSVFANDGKKHVQHMIKKIDNDTGEIYIDKTINGEQVISSDVARKINSILSDNDARAATFGVNSPLAISGKTVAAKTGTTQDFRDAWTVGYTPKISVAVWAGNNNSQLMTGEADGIFVAAPIWRSFMDAISADYFSEVFVPYQSEISVNQNSAILLSSEDLANQQMVAEEAAKNSLGKQQKHKKKH
jgi:1A family penicillin-binding protein